MDNGVRLPIERVKWITLMTMTIVIFVVDASTLGQTKESIILESIQEKYDPKDLSAQKVSYEGDYVLRIHKYNMSVQELMERYEEDGSLSIWSSSGSTADIFVRSYMFNDIRSILENHRIKFIILIDDVQEAIANENTPLTMLAQEELEGRKARYVWWQGVRNRYTRPRPLRYPVTSVHGGGGRWHFRGHRMEWTSYHQLKDILGYLDYLADTYPDVCSVQTIGRSIEGRELKLLRISNGKPNAPAIWIDGGIHAREWISPAVVTYIIDQLVENSENLDVDYYILPVANPDGYEYTFAHDRLWRKNRRKGTICSGVDLNRNFGYHWGGKGTSRNMCHETYAGTKAFSEPESDAIRNFFEASLANFKAYLSFHSYGQYILYPWGYDNRLPVDYADLDRVGKQMAAAMENATNDDIIYTVGNSASTLYPAAGGSDDWAKALVKIKYAYTIELRDTKSFILPARYIIPTSKEAYAAVNVITEICKTAS